MLNTQRRPWSQEKEKKREHAKSMKPSNRLFGQQFIDRDWLGFRTFEKHFDYVSWLNQQ